ncbi:MAG: phosphatase PAP2 family protein, partial [Specibacter sp.]
ATVTAMVSTAVVLNKLWMWISGAILSVAMMYSRTYLGAHWLSDTIAGALLGVGVTLLLWAAAQNKCLMGNIRMP